MDRWHYQYTNVENNPNSEDKSLKFKIRKALILKSDYFSIVQSNLIQTGAVVLQSQIPLERASRLVMAKIEI